MSYDRCSQLENIPVGEGIKGEGYMCVNFILSIALLNDFFHIMWIKEPYKFMENPKIIHNITYNFSSPGEGRATTINEEAAKFLRFLFAKD